MVCLAMSDAAREIDQNAWSNINFFDAKTIHWPKENEIMMY